MRGSLTILTLLETMSILFENALNREKILAMHLQDMKIIRSIALDQEILEELRLYIKLYREELDKAL